MKSIPMSTEAKVASEPEALLAVLANPGYRFKRMRILVVSEVTGFMRGGVPAEAVQLIRGLQARSHQLALLSDIPIEGTGPVGHFPLSLPIDHKLSSQLRAAINEFKPDLIHILAMSSRGIVQIAQQLRSIPWAFTCHSLPPYERKIQYLHWNETAHYAARSFRFVPNTIAWKWLFRNGFISHAIVHSQFVEDIVRRYGQPKNRICPILLGCEITDNVKLSPQLARSRGQLRLLTIAGIAHSKGCHDALMAFADLRRTFPDLEYEIVGEVRDQSYLSYLQTMIKRLGLGNSVRFSLNATDTEKDKALRRADIYLQPSHEEGFCLAFIEAASIVPLLIGTDTGAIRSICANDIGARVVPVRQPSRIADAVRELCATSLPPDFLSQRRARLAMEFSWSKYLDAHEVLYKSLTT
jgi:glycosyltransferase involved in cell wall biosynthesis